MRGTCLRRVSERVPEGVMSHLMSLYGQYIFGVCLRRVCEGDVPEESV